MCLEVCASLSLPSILLAFRQVCVSSKGGEERVQVYVRKYADVSWSFALPHKSGDTGPSLISPFNLRVGNFVVVCVYICNRECAIESSSSIPSFRSKDDLIIILCYCRILN